MEIDTLLLEVYSEDGSNSMNIKQMIKELQEAQKQGYTNVCLNVDISYTEPDHLDTYELIVNVTVDIEDLKK